MSRSTTAAIAASLVVSILPVPLRAPDGDIAFQHNEGIASVPGKGGTITHLT